MRFNFRRRYDLPRSNIFPKLPDGEKHPLPFYMTPEVTLPSFSKLPWEEAIDQEERQRFQEIRQNPSIALYFTNEFLTEALDEEIIALASLLITETKMKETTDEETLRYVETEIFHPTIQREVLVCVWELLYEWGRDLSPQEFKEMQNRDSKLQMSPKSKELLTVNMLEKLSSSDDLRTEKKLSGERWEVLLYNYKSKLQQNSFKTNVAYHMLQKIIIFQIAAEEIMKKGILPMIEKDMVTLDEMEKIRTPPREG